MADTRIRLSQHLQRALVRGLARLPAELQVRLSGEPPVIVDGQTLDPHVQLVRSLRRRRNSFGLCEPNPEAARARFRAETMAFTGPRTPVRAVHSFAIPGESGPLRVRHYAPDSTTEPQPLTVYLHGGGFVIGDLDTHDEPCRLLCSHAGVHVLSVDYRLAPEHPFPAGLHDAQTALRWARAHTAGLGADPARVTVGGDSAGGNLAAVVAQLAARDGQAPAAQLLIYPSTDSRTPRPSQALFSDGYFLSDNDRAGFTRCYLDGTGITGADPRVSPLRAADLSGLPPALVVTAGFDILRDEGEAYAAALQTAGTPALLVRAPDLGHGFIHMTGVTPAAREAVIQITRDWRALLAASCLSSPGT